MDKKIVYLDTKFWLILRDTSLGRKTGEKENNLLNKVLELAKFKKCIFPISEDIFLEVLKQTDEETLDETVKLIDKLSNGVSLISFDERVFLEILQFMYISIGSPVYNCKELVWTKLVYNMGFVTPINNNIDKNQDQAIQKSFIDHMWSISFKDITGIMRKNAGNKRPEMPNISDKLNRGKLEHAHENNTFKKMFLSELAGTLDAYKSDFPKIMGKIYKQKTGLDATEDELTRPESGHQLCNIIYNTFKSGKAGDRFPSIGILSGLYAATRWDKDQKFENNDIHDFRHAASALPYTDYFFTEKGLAHLITQKSTEYDKLYSCNVQCKITGAYEALAEV